MIRYCARCVTASSRPHISFDASGVCNACRLHERKSEIDWAERERAFRDVVARARSESDGYDCLVPVSGGKDSTWQIVTCLEYDLRPLAVTWKPPARTELGQRNLDNLVGLGVDHIDYTINPSVERVFLYRSFERHGTTAIPMHMALFNTPLRLAVKLEIPLVLWGENSAFEYGGIEDERRGFRMDRGWLKRFGVMQGTVAEDWVSEDLTKRELAGYSGPTDREMDDAGVLAVFLGYYFRWDPRATMEVARAHGFACREEGPRVGYYDFADIDDDFISIHHHLKWYKFGFTRTFDNLSIEIRNGRLSRDDAVRIIGDRGDETPHGDIKCFSDYVGITADHFFEVAERFRNLEIWSRSGGVWRIPGFLIPDWDWKP